MVMGAALAATRLTRWSVGTVGRISAPVLRRALDPPLVPHSWRPRTVLDGWGLQWRARREHQVDLSAVVLAVLERLDTSAVLDQVLREVDLTTVVLDEVDLGQVVRSALDQVDLTEVVLTRVALDAIVLAALDRLDLTGIVAERVDLASLAEQVMDDIDLPEIIQESTGSVASEAVQSARLASVDADEAISRFADRLLFRARRRVQSGAALESETTTDADTAGQDTS
jgi:hypothetical protein